MKGSDIKVGEFYASSRSLRGARKGQIIEVGVQGNYSRRNDASMVKTFYENGEVAGTEYWSNRDIKLTWAEWLVIKAKSDAREAAAKAIEDAIAARVETVAHLLGLQVVSGNYRETERGVEITHSNYWIPMPDKLGGGSREHEPAVTIPLALLEEALS